MQLVRLEMYGFKSFSKKTEFHFSPGITAFVGPNGCGKSNVVDAIRWVLGEQNPRALRANKMEDLIYAGSENSQQKNYAEVSIVLDNSEGEIPLDYREVTVTRRFYRSGDSEYFLNRVPCRLKDISETLASSSLGRGTYSIIGQGQVEEVISSRPEDRRLMFEEAAGIALYKMRKREAVKKLADTQSHLTRIDDIVHELREQESEIREAAEVAREYLDHKDKADKLELSLWAARYTDLKKRLEKLDERKQELEESKKFSCAKAEGVEQQLAATTSSLQECADVIAALEQGKTQLSGNKTELEYQLQLAEQRQADFGNMIVTAQQQMKQLQALAEEASGGVTRVQAEITGLTEQIGCFSDALHRRSNAAGFVRRFLACAEMYRARADDWIMHAAMENTEITTDRDAARQAEAELTGQADSARQELERWGHEADQIQGEINSFLAKLAVLEDKCRLLSAAEDQVSREYNALEAAKESQTGKIRSLENSLTRLKQKLDMLSLMEEEMQGFNPGTRAVLKAAGENNFPGILGAVADLIHVRSPKHSLALETALGGALQYVVCADEDTCRRAIELLKKTGAGRATFVPVTAAEQRTYPSRPDRFTQPVLGWADQLVDCPDHIKPVTAMLLGNVLVSENLASATKLAVEINYKYRIVTLEGELISRGLFTGGTQGKTPGLLQRKASAEEIGSQHEAMSRQLKELQAELARIEAEGAKLFAKREQARTEKSVAEKDLLKIQAQVEQIRVQYEQTAKHIDLCKERQQDLTRKIQDARRSYEGLTSRMDKDKAGLEKLNVSKQLLQDVETRLREMVSLWASRQNSLQLTIFSLQNQMENRHRQAKHLENQHGDLCNRIAAVEEDACRNREQHQTIMGKIEETKLALSEISLGLESVAASLDGQAAIHARLKGEINEAGREAAKIREEIEQINTALHEAEVKSARWQAEEEGMTRELTGQFGITPQEGLANFDARFTINELSVSLRRLRNRMEELGEVNLASIPQHKKLVDRLDFLTGQQTDLAKAEQDILDLVDELDRTIRSLFMDTFENVQQHFSEIFKILFDGGSAYLSLSDQDDLLETGIEIYARPSGKRMQSLSLLSGGEKAMTAIALLFALQSVRPSPFCILDEIEAALDDVNIIRFASYLRQLAEKMQFILITHRRETMEHSDSLYGITLAKDGDGGSQPISVVLNKDQQRMMAQ